VAKDVVIKGGLGEEWAEEEKDGGGEEDGEG